MIITASIVTYKADPDELKKCIDSMRKNGIASWFANGYLSCESEEAPDFYQYLW